MNFFKIFLNSTFKGERDIDIHNVLMRFVDKTLHKPYQDACTVVIEY